MYSKLNLIMNKGISKIFMSLMVMCMLSFTSIGMLNAQNDAFFRQNYDNQTRNGGNINLTSSNEWSFNNLETVNEPDNTAPLGSGLLLLSGFALIGLAAKGKRDWYGMCSICWYDLVKNKKLASKYKNGYCLIFRLCVDDYHRYCYIDNGNKTSNKFINGVLYTVRPVVLGNYNIYKENSREYTILKTENFGDVVHIEVGATIVGRIKNHHEEYTFKKGEEKGMFEFGGSTIVLLIEKNRVTIDKEILDNTKQGYETVVKYGEKIGNKGIK